MNKVNKDALNALIGKLLGLAFIGVLLSIPLTEFFFRLVPLIISLVIIWLAYLGFAGVLIYRYCRFKKSVAFQIKKYNPNTDFDLITRNVANAVMMTQDWFLAPSKGIAICREAFEVSVVADKNKLRINDSDGHSYYFKVPKNSLSSYNENLNTWSFADNVDDEIIFTSAFNSYSITLNVVLVCLLALLCTRGMRGLVNDIRFLVDDVILNNKAQVMIQEVYKESIYDQDIMEEYSKYVYPINYVNGHLNVYRDGEQYLIENDYDYLACGIVKFYDENNNYVDETKPLCVRPYGTIKGEANSKGVSHSLDELYYFGNYYGFSYVEHRSSDSSYGVKWINITKKDLSYYDVEGFASNLYAETILVNETSAMVYIYDEEQATKYRNDYGDYNYAPSSAKYLLKIDVVNKKVDVFYNINGEFVLTDTIEKY